MRYARSIVILALLIVPSVAQSKIPGDKIKIGVLQDLPEPYASAAGNGGIVAAQLAASDVEKEYLEGDAEILPDTSEGGIGAELDRVREWIEKEHVAAVVSSANTAVNEQIARMVEARHRTLLITGDGADWTDRPCSPSVIVWGTGRAARIRALAQVSASQNKNRWYLVADQNPSGVASEAASRNALASVGGQVVGTTERVVGSRDFTDTISAVDKTNAELVVLEDSDEDLVSALRSLALIHPQHPVAFAAPTGTIFDIDQAGPASADGLVVTAPFYWNADEQSRRFASRWEDRMRGEHVTQNAADVYAATLGFLHAAKAVDDVDTRKVGAELRRGPIKDTLFGTVKVRQDGQVIRDVSVYRVKTPENIQQRWAYYENVAKVPGTQAFPSAECAGPQ